MALIGDGPRLRIWNCRHCRFERKDEGRNGESSRKHARAGGDAEVRGRVDKPEGAEEATGRGRGQRDNGRGGRPALRGRRQQPQRLPRAQPGHVHGRHHAAHTKAEDRQLLPRGRRRALPARRPRRGGGGGRDVRDGHVDPQGAARRRASRQGPGRIAHPVPVARRHLHQVPPRRPRGLHRRGHRNRLRRGRVAARAGPGRSGHRVLRLVGGVPARHQGPRRPRRPARDLRRPQGPGQGNGRGVPGRVVAALRRAPDARLHARGRLALAQEARGAHNVARLPREGRGDRPRHVPRHLRHAARVPPQGRRPTSQRRPSPTRWRT